ncbi:hypothetical protein EJ06DRAFT_489003 [Trichodelitschia bisporula]|uniref:Intracellular protein transport protein n=1 Tax=Trichodelitschia bisporula TaxID=703511 RepID=A0A6G1I6T3_9PEZI|nr:hypothetical protein EJ06DRAFT_489003 [Trichodelitschia bisporula]
MLRMLEAQAPAKQTATDTIRTLGDRLNTATLLEDRRAAIFGLRSFAKEYPASVASGALRGLIGCLARDVEDVDTVKPVLETLLMLFSPNEDSPEASEDIALWLADEFTQRQDNIQILLDLLDTPDFYSRLYSLQLLSAIFAARPERTQECVLSAALGVSRLVATLDDSRDAIRNACLLLLSDVAQSSTELQKLIAFENAFERIFALIDVEGSLNLGGIVVQDCLDLLANLVRHNASNQSLFRESGCVAKLSKLLQSVSKAPENRDEETWPSQQSAKNVWGLLAVIRLFLVEGNFGTDENQTIFYKHGMLQQALNLAFNGATELPIKAEALSTCADMIRRNPEIQTSFAQLQVSPVVEKSAHPPNGMNGIGKVYIIDALLDLVISPTSKVSFDIRLAACECIKAYFDNHAQIRLHFLNRAIDGHMSGEDETANVLTTLIRGSGEFRQKNTDPYRIWFASVIVFHLLWEDPEAKHRLQTVSEGDASSGEEVITCIQSLAANLITGIQNNDDERTLIAYATVLTGWLFEDPPAVNDFLTEASNVQILKHALSSPHPLTRGLSAILLGTLYEFSTKDSPLPRRSLAPLLTTPQTRTLYLASLTALRHLPLIRDFDLLPSHPDDPAPRAFFDPTFVSFLKDHAFSRLTRAIDRDPRREAALPTHEGGIDRDALDELRARLGEAEAKAREFESKAVELERGLGTEQALRRREGETAAAEVRRITSVNEALRRAHEEEIVETKGRLGAEIESVRVEGEKVLKRVRGEGEKRIKELEREVEEIRVAAKKEAERTKEYYERMVGGLRSGKRDVEARLQEALDGHEGLAKELDEAEQALKEARESEANARTELGAVKAELEKRVKEVEELKASETTLKEGLEDEKTKVSMLEKEVAELEKEVAQLGSRTDGLNKAVEKEKKLAAEKEEARKAAQTELDDLLLILSELEEKRAKDKKRLKELGEEVSDGEDEDEDEEEEEEADVE